MVKRVGENIYPCGTSTVVSNQSPVLPLKRTAQDSVLILEVSDDSDKVGADVILLRVCPQSCMPNLVEGLLEVSEDTIEVLLVLEIFLT